MKCYPRAISSPVEFICSCIVNHFSISRISDTIHIRSTHLVPISEMSLSPEAVSAVARTSNAREGVGSPIPTLVNVPMSILVVLLMLFVF